MKTSFKLNEGNCVSKLDIHDRNNTLLKVLDFDFSTINNWYPLNFEYDLIYRLEHSTIQLISTARGELMHPDYGLNSPTANLEFSVKQGLDQVTIRPVQLDNNLVCAKAKEMDLPTWVDEEFTYLDVQSAMKKVEHDMDSLTGNKLKDYYYDLGQDEKVNYMGLTYELKEYVALEDLSETELDSFVLYGKIYTMLSIMRKLAKLYAS